MTQEIKPTMRKFSVLKGNWIPVEPSDKPKYQEAHSKYKCALCGKHTAEATGPEEVCEHCSAVLIHEDDKWADRKNSKTSNEDEEMEQEQQGRGHVR